MTQVRDQGRPARDTDRVAESAGILLRVSSKGQDEENQTPELETYCYDQGYRINRRYQLHDVSAYHGEQESALAEILEDIRAGVITVLVIVDSSRIDRRDPDIAALYHLSIRIEGGRIESVREPLFGKSDIAGRITTMLAQHSNNDYSAKLSYFVGLGHDRVRREGGLFGRAPFGYEIQGEKYRKRLVPTPLGLKYVPEIFARVIRGESLATVAAWLNAEGVPCGTKVARDKRHQAIPGKLPRWTAATVSKIIRNSVYKGQMRDSSHKMVNRCEAIVSAAVFSRAVARLDNAPTRRGPRNIADRSMLSAVLFCDECGSPVYRSTSETRVYYRCAGKVTGKSCFMIRLAAVDSAVDRLITSNPRRIMAPKLIPGRNYDDELDANMAEIRALDVDDDGYEGRHAALMAERARLKDLDTTPDRWEMRPTGQTWGSVWNGLRMDERAAWLESKAFTVRASKTKVAVEQGGKRAEIDL
jgi:DNA invertase Pin-like site-specific DNA recombinase